MKHSDQINELLAALALAQADMRAADKTGYNPHFKSQFADYTDMVAASRPALSKNGLSVIHCIRDKEEGSFIVTILGHSSGQYITSEMRITSEKNTVQSLGSAITYLKRYCYAAIIGLAAQEKEDDDGTAAVGINDSNESSEITPKAVWAMLYKEKDEAKRKTLMNNLADRANGARINDFNQEQCEMAIELLEGYFHK